MALTPQDNQLVEFVGSYVGRLQIARAKARKEITNEFKPRIDALIERRIKPDEDRLIAAIQQAYDTGLPAVVIRDEVFHGNYAAWSKWRDAAGIPKEGKN